MLDNFRPRLFVEVGLSADWGAEFLKIIRTLEPDSHDPALLYEQVSDWFQRQRRLFQELCILDELPNRGPEAQSATWHAVNNAMQCPPLCVRGRMFHLWSAAHGDKEMFMETAEHLSNLVEASIDRVKAELLDSVQTDFQVFHIARWHKSLAMSLNDLDTFQKCTRLRLRRLCKMAQERNEEDTLSQYAQVMPILHDKQVEWTDRDGVVPDNRVVWAIVFDSAFPSQVNSAGRLDELRSLVAFQIDSLCMTFSLTDAELAERSSNVGVGFQKQLSMVVESERSQWRKDCCNLSMQYVWEHSHRKAIGEGQEHGCPARKRKK